MNPASALAQRQPATPEQRLDRLERQVQQMQRQVFPKGRRRTRRLLGRSRRDPIFGRDARPAA